MKIPLSQILLILPCLIYAEERPAIGNFALSISQQPTPLVSFGENIIDKGQVQLFLFADAFIGKHSYLTDVIPSVLYGIRDDLSFSSMSRSSPRNKNKSHHSSGIEDIFADSNTHFIIRKVPV